MTDVPPKSALSNVLGMSLKAKAARPTPLPIMNPEELHDESIRYAIAATNQLRDDLNATRAKLVEVTNELAQVKTDTASELMVTKQEYESKLANARADNEALRRQINEVGQKLEHYSRWSHQLETQCADYERFFSNSLGTIYDAGQHSALALSSAINNATSSLQDAAKHLADGLSKQIAHSVDDARNFLADIKKKGGQREYRPPSSPPKPQPQQAMEPLDPEAEARLEEMIKSLGSKENQDS